MTDLTKLSIGSTGEKRRFDPIPVEGFELRADGVYHNGTRLPDASQAHIVHYGLGQWLGDATAAKKDENLTRDQAAERIAARVEKLRTGDFTRTRGESGPSDDEGTVAKQIGREEVLAAIKAANVAKPDKDTLAAAVAGYFTANEKRLRKEAARRIALRKEQAQTALAGLGDDVLKALGMTAPAPSE